MLLFWDYYKTKETEQAAPLKVTNKKPKRQPISKPKKEELEELEELEEVEEVEEVEDDIEE